MTLLFKSTNIFTLSYIILRLFSFVVFKTFLTCFAIKPLSSLAEQSLLQVEENATNLSESVSEKNAASLGLDEG